MSAGVLGFLFWLLYFRSAVAGAPSWTSSLPTLNACLNFSSAVLLTAGFVAIKNGHRELHKKLMFSAVLVAGTFLVSYIIYHHFHGDTRFGGEGLIRPIYFFVLISHIALSMVTLPLVLTTLFFAGTKVDRGIKRAGQRPNQQHERQDLGPCRRGVLPPSGHVARFD